MSGIRIVLLSWAAFCLGCTASAVQATQPQGNSLARASVLTETREYAAGETGYVGVHLKMQKGWHMYWRYAGDSGAPILVDWDVPEGVSIGDPLWPAPVRYIDGGALLNYTYEHEVLIIFPIEIGADVTAGTGLTINADVSWLICKEYCFPGGGEASVTVRVGDDAQPTPAREQFEAARQRLPREWKEAESAGVSATWTEGDLVLRAPGATQMEFYPYPESEDVEVLPSDSLMKSGSSKGDRLAITYGEDARTAEHVLGVLCVYRGKDVVYYAVDLPGPDRVSGSR